MIIDSVTIQRYKKEMDECIHLLYPNIPPGDLDKIMDYSILKRYRESPASIDNSYTHKSQDGTLLEIIDYVEKRKPITTAFGTMFLHHEEVPNPLFAVVQMFLDQRNQYKKTMFKYPKGSEMFEKFNLLQLLSKIDANGKLHIAA